MENKISLILTILFLSLVSIETVIADQVIWNDDSNIEIYDTWEDINGLPLTGATCNWYVFNQVGTINQSGIPNELTAGIINFTVNKLEIGIYPMLINCTDGYYNGSSSIRELKIVDELTEDFKDNLEEINATTVQTNRTTIEINQTTHMTYDLLRGEINVLRQAVYELKIQVQDLLKRVEVLEKTK